MARKPRVVRLKAPKDEDEYTPRLSKAERAIRHRKAQAAYRARKATAMRWSQRITDSEISPPSSSLCLHDTETQGTNPGANSLDDEPHGSTASPSSVATQLAAVGDATSLRSRRENSPESTCCPRSLTSTITSRHSGSGPVLAEESHRVWRLLRSLTALNDEPLTPPTSFARSFWVRFDHKEFNGHFLSETQLLDVRRWIYSQ
ncbi:hypothetical protein R3P38DRAFT_3228161 [Favolaschia claudopus]|uniref:Uncharacterized protein n=1 Tax=Favolaschia claudopus TaxID=2862362 RepID=A0AAV9ZRS5_9AGAR